MPQALDRKTFGSNWPTTENIICHVLRGCNARFAFGKARPRKPWVFCVYDWQIRLRIVTLKEIASAEGREILL